METDRECTRPLFKGVTPFETLMDPNVSSQEFDSELGAVWYAANYYFETSYNAHREFGGIVFRKPNGKYGLTIQRDGTADAFRYRGELAPPDAVAVAFSHTHVPKHPLYEAALTLFEGKTWRDLSGDPDGTEEEKSDIGLIKRLSKRARRMGYAHQMFSLYASLTFRSSATRPTRASPCRPGPSLRHPIWPADRWRRHASEGKGCSVALSWVPGARRFIGLPPEGEIYAARLKSLCITS